MIAPRLKPADLTGSITVRLLLLLSFILLPLGAIAVFQTWSLAEEVENRAKTALLMRTLTGTTTQAQILDRAIGANEALGQITPFVSSGEECDSTFFRRFTRAGERFTFAGRLERDLTTSCNSADTVIDLSENETVIEAFQTGQPFAYSTPRGQASGIAVVVIGHPVFDGNEIDHFAVVSLATQTVIPALETPALSRSLAVVSYNSSGRILSANSVGNNPAQEMPGGDDLSRLTPTSPTVFEAEARNGEDRVFVVIPLRQALVYVLASYPSDILLSEGAAGALPAWVLPLLMWIATLIVVYIAVSRLVVTPVQLLARRMRRFAKNRAMPSPLPMGNLPSELREMNETFEKMASAILRDEAELENALREKSILVREIHHRVKNNLQLIASIMNMQIRKSRMSETSDVVRRLQERVLGLATVHRQMYESSSLTDVDIGPLLDEILRQVLRRDVPEGLSISTEIADAELIPDQAVPLALLAAEASMNAVRYVGQSDLGEGWIEVTFRVDDEGVCNLTVANSVTPSDHELEEIKGGTRGLGTQLIQAFAAQLGGTIEVDEERDVYRIRVAFSPIENPGSDAAAEVIQRARVSAA